MIIICSVIEDKNNTMVFVVMSIQKISHKRSSIYFRLFTIYPPTFHLIIWEAFSDVQIQILFLLFATIIDFCLCHSLFHPELISPRYL